MHIQVFGARRYLEEYKFVNLGYHLGIIIGIILNVLVTHSNCSNLVIIFSFILKLSTCTILHILPLLI